jgi:hypothetical protein
MLKSSTHVVKFASLVPLLAGSGVVAPSQNTGFRPTLRLEKQVYAQDETIRFWVGVTSESKIPAALRTSCILHWIRPDGSRFDQPLSWPIDGDSSHGWEGGTGFGKRSPSLGRYVVSFEFASQRTADQNFEVVANPLSSSIEAHWIFVNSESGVGVRARSAILHIENRTGRVLRFAKPGLTGSEVWLHVKGFQPASDVSTFVPESAVLRADEIPPFVLQQLDWESQSRWPMVTVPPGRSADRPLDLRSSYSFREGLEYEVNVSTELTVFVGEQVDFDARLFPLRIPVSATAHFRW